MASPLRFNVRENEAIRNMLRDLNPSASAFVVDQALEAVATLTEQRAKEVEIVRGRGLTSPPLRHRVSFRSGRLSASISTDRSQRPRLYSVGSTVRYAPVHELGLGPYPRRPFLQPAAEWVIETKAPAVFERALSRARSRA